MHTFHEKNPRFLGLKKPNLRRFKIAAMLLKIELYWLAKCLNFLHSFLVKRSGGMVNISSDEHIRFLHAELRERNLKNPRYSLRAFARDLGVSASRLSELLRGKGKMSTPFAQSIAEALGPDSEKAKLFLSMVLAEKSQNSTERQMAEKQVRLWKNYLAVEELMLDEFQQMSDWYYLGIWNFLHLKTKNNVPGICDEFPDLSVETVKSCLQTLTRFDLVEEEDGYYFATKEKLKAFYEFSSFAVRQYHKGMMQKAAKTLDDLPLEERYFLSHIFCIGEEQYQQIQEKMNTFFKELSLELKESRPEKLDAVYSVGAQCFRLNRSKVVAD